MTYSAKEYAPGRWHVVDEQGIPLYDGAPYGKDKPRVFDEDGAEGCVVRMNLLVDQEDAPDE